MKQGHVLLAKYFILSISCYNRLGAKVETFGANISNEALASDSKDENGNMMQIDQMR